MANIIKYSTTGVTNTLNKGNFYLGVNSDTGGPTSTTDFWNGIQPPISGYTLYGNKNDAFGPSIHVFNNDTELISFVNQRGGGVTTTYQAINYFSANDEFMLVNKDYEDVVTSGLILSLDAGFSVSYPKSGTSWQDLTINNISGITTNNPVFDSEWGGNLYFNNTSQRVNLVNSPLLSGSSNNISMEVFINFTQLDYTGSTGNLTWFYTKGSPDSAAPNSGIYFGYDNRTNGSGFTYTCFGNTAGGFAGGGNNFGASVYNHAFTPGSWNHIAFTIDDVSGKLYINGVQKGPDKTFSNLDIASATSPFMNVPTATATPQYPKISSFKVYDRALTAEEILQNYNAMFYQYTNNLRNRVQIDGGYYEDNSNYTTEILKDI